MDQPSAHERYPRGTTSSVSPGNGFDSRGLFNLLISGHHFFYRKTHGNPDLFNQHHEKLTINDGFVTSRSVYQSGTIARFSGYCVHLLNIHLVMALEKID